MTRRLFIGAAVALGLALVGPAAASADVCENGPATCQKVTGPWVPVKPDASRGWTLSCPSPMVANQVLVSPPDNFGPDVDYNRDHWTITAWLADASNTSASFEAHNWNTIFGDTWHFQPLLGCVPPGTVPSAGTNAGRFGTPDQGRTTVGEIRILRNRASTLSVTCPRGQQLLGSAYAYGHFSRRPQRRNDAVRVRHREAGRRATAVFIGGGAATGAVRGQLRARCGSR